MVFALKLPRHCYEMFSRLRRGFYSNSTPASTETHSTYIYMYACLSSNSSFIKKKSLCLNVRKVEMSMTQKPLAVRILYTKGRPMSEFDKLLKRENESMAAMVCFMMFFLFACSMILFIFSSNNPNSKIGHIPHFHLYTSAVAGTIVVMFVYAVYRVIAQSARIWKEKDNFYCNQSKQDVYPQTFNL